MMMVNAHAVGEDVQQRVEQRIAVDPVRGFLLASREFASRLLEGGGLLDENAAPAMRKSYGVALARARAPAGWCAFPAHAATFGAATPFLALSPHVRWGSYARGHAAPSNPLEGCGRQLWGAGWSITAKHRSGD